MDEAEKAIRDLDGRYFEETRLVAEFAKPKGTQPPNLVSDDIYFTSHPRIYVGRLNGSVKRKELLEMFAKHGEIVDILMKEDFAFIEYIKAGDAV